MIFFFSCLIVNVFSDGYQDFVHWGKSLQVLSLLTGSKSLLTGLRLGTAVRIYQHLSLGVICIRN